MAREGGEAQVTGWEPRPEEESRGPATGGAAPHSRDEGPRGAPGPGPLGFHLYEERDPERPFAELTALAAVFKVLAALIAVAAVAVLFGGNAVLAAAVRRGSDLFWYAGVGVLAVSFAVGAIGVVFCLVVAHTIRLLLAIEENTRACALACMNTLATLHRQDDA